jgi:hypothetical protein
MVLQILRVLPFAQLAESLAHPSPVKKSQYCWGKLNCQIVLTLDFIPFVTSPLFRQVTANIREEETGFSEEEHIIP